MPLMFSCTDQQRLPLQQFTFYKGRVYKFTIVNKGPLPVAGGQNQGPYIHRPKELIPDGSPGFWAGIFT